MVTGCKSMADLIVALSYFDRKIGPTVYMEYPERVGEEEKMTLNQIFDQTTSEGWFWHSLNTKDYATSLNYYFEIKSDWARGLKEMLMCSIIFKEKMGPDKEHDVLSWLTDLIQKMHARHDLFKAFYPAPKTIPGPETPVTSESDSELNQSYVVVMKWLKELYYSTREEIRQKNDEEIIANLMVNPAVFNTIRKLSQHPVRMHELKAWFDARDFNRDFDKIISMLEEQKFIVINKIGSEIYAILVKSIDVSRVPPASAMELFDKMDLPQPVVEHYINLVGAYFNNYDAEKDEADKLKLFSAMSMPKHYNLISELRKKPLAKAQIGAILRQGPVVATKINVLEDLKTDNIIDEFEYQGMTYVMLKTDIIIEDEFPEYIKKALPEAEKIAKIPRHFILPQIPADVREDLKGLFGDDEFLTEQKDEALAKGRHPPAPASANMEGPTLDDSPFDVIVDKMTTKFITSQRIDAEPAKKHPDGVDLDSNRKD
jgi:hypothetical protein